MSQMMDDEVKFGAYNLLSVPGLRITGVDTHREASNDIKSFDLAYTDRSVTTSSFQHSRPLNIRAVITRRNRDELDASIGILKKILRPKKQVLRLPVEGAPRDFYDVTKQNIGFEDTAGGYTALDIEFKCDDPYSHAITATTLLNVANLTSGNKSYPITLDGTAPQLPLITYTVDSFTVGSNRTVTFIEPISGMQIAVQRTWTAADVLVINCLTQEVQVNGVDVEFTGNFPEWSPGGGFVNYTDDFTARQVDILVTYLKRYL